MHRHDRHGPPESGVSHRQQVLHHARIHRQPAQPGPGTPQVHHSSTADGPADPALPPLQAHSFELELDATSCGQYKRGGLVVQVKQPKVLSFKSLAQALAQPGEFLLSDFSKMERSAALHVGFQALHKFQVRGSSGAAVGLLWGFC
jgi:hypothetical protein